MATPLTDSINALTTYANEVTGGSDTNLSDAVHTLASGYGRGGSTVSAPRKDVNFIDYDGTILHSYTTAEALALTALPENPSHDGLTAQGWNWSLADMKSQVQSMGKCDIGQMYITDDGKTRIYVHFEEGRTSPYLGIGVNGSVEVDWGDGSNTETLTGTSLTTVTTAQHIYAPGDYVIKLTVVSGSFTFFGALILQKSTSASTNVSGVYTNAVQKIELGNGITNIGDSAFSNCYSLSNISIPKEVTSVGSYAFSNCYSLSSITIPEGVTSVESNAFYNCYSLSSIVIPEGVTIVGSDAFFNCHSLSSIVIPEGVTSVGSGAFSNCFSLSSIVIPEGVTSVESNAFFNCFSLSSIVIPEGVTSVGIYAFSNCYSLSSIVIPEGVTSIGSNAFSYCYSLSSITIPEGVTSVGNSAFSNCCGMAEYHFLPITPPAIAKKNIFNNIQTDCIIYVPYSEDHSILEAYKTATNWSTYASYMQEEAA